MLENNVIMLTMESDGNWKGRMLRYGKEIEVRAISPQYALEMLLTHE